MANEAENAIYSRLASAPTHHPASANLFASDWGLQPGDVVTVQSGTENYSMPVYSMNLNWKGNSRVEIQSTGNEKREPLSELKRKRYGAGSSAYRANKAIQAGIQETENEVAMIISNVGDDGVVTAASIVAAINNAESTVTINADRIVLNGQTSIADLFTVSGVAVNMSVNRLSATEIVAESLESEYGTIRMGQYDATWQEMQVLDSNNLVKTIRYLGRTSS